MGLRRFAAFRPRVARQTKRKRCPATALQSMKILIVDDKPENLYLLRALLARKWLLLKCDMADEVEGIEGRADLLVQCGEDNAVLL